MIEFLNLNLKYIYRFEIKLKIEKVKHKINVVLNQMKDYNENNFLTRMIAMTVTTVWIMLPMKEVIIKVITMLGTMVLHSCNHIIYFNNGKSHHNDIHINFIKALVIWVVNNEIYVWYIIIMFINIIVLIIIIISRRRWFG